MNTEQASKHIFTYLKNSLNFHLPKFLYIKKEKMAKRGCHFNIFKKWYKIRNNKRPDDKEDITDEIGSKISKNLLITCRYRPPISAIKGLYSYLENVFKKANTKNKLYFVVDNFDLNCLDYNENLENRTLYNRIFPHGYIPLITRPPRVTSKTVFLIDNILKSFIFDNTLEFKKGIMKRDVFNDLLYLFL